MALKSKIVNRYKKGDIWILLAVFIGVLAVLRYFYALLGDYYTFLDEYPTFDAAVGFFKTGKFYKWDFYTDTLSDIAYSRAWPHTILLTLWFHIFGISVPAGKALSAVFGVMFILSVYYITYRIYENYYITILSCLFLLGNPSVTVVFRQIRMYSLWLLMIVWFLYFVFMALEMEGDFSSKNSICVFLKKNFNYPFKYIIFSLITLIFCYAIHINTLVCGAGIIFLLFYLLFTKRDRRYMVAVVCLGAAILLFGILCFLVSKGIRIPVVHLLYQVLISDNFIGQYDWENIRYWYWLRDFMGNRWIMLLVCGCLLFAFVHRRKDRDKKNAFTLYCVFIILSSLFCFLYIFSQYYQDRYIIYIAPLIAISGAWGIVETACYWKRCVVWGVFGLFTMTTLYQVKTNFMEVYYNDDICYHSQVYGKIREDAGTGSVAIAGYDFRDYYAVRELDDYITVSFDRAHDMEILSEFAREYPQGYVVVETGKMYGISESVRVFMQNHSEQIAGDGIDEWNIDVSRYHFLYPQIDNLEMFEGTGWENGCVMYSFNQIEQCTEIRIAVNTSQMAENAKILFLSFGIFTENQESLPLCFQIVLPENSPKGVYFYSVVVDKPCLAVELKDDCEVYYADESYKEIKLWEK